VVRTFKKLFYSVKVTERALNKLLHTAKALSRPHKRLLQYNKPLAVALKVFRYAK
jgi:hypothetical protein